MNVKIEFYKIIYRINIIHLFKQYKMVLGLTNNKDTDRLILNRLDDKNLVIFCSTNKSWRNLYFTDEILWMTRTYQRFPYLSSDLIKKYKKDITWREYYIRLIKICKKSNFI